MKWSGKIGQRAKMYPTRMNGCGNDEAIILLDILASYRMPS